MRKGVVPMKGKDIIKHIARAEMPNIEQVRENCHRQAIAQKQKKPLLRRVGFAAATATVLVVCFIFGSIFFSSQDGGASNLFIIRAYAMERQADGSAMLREIDLFEQSHSWGGFLDGENFYLSIRLRAEGENIQSVEFFTDDGFFAKQYIEMENGGIVLGDAPILYVGESDFIAVFGTDFEIVGSSLILDSDAITDDLLLFLGLAVTDGQIPRQMTIHAIATFHDSTTQEETISISLEDRMGVMIISGDDIDESTPAHAEWWRNINLEEAELLPESIKIISDILDGIIYEFHVDGFHAPLVIYGYQLEFDENGIAWGSFMSDFLVSDRKVYFSVIKRGDDGVLTGMVYRVQVTGGEMGLQEVQINPIG